MRIRQHETRKGTILCVVVVVIMSQVDLSYPQHVFPEHTRRQCSAIKKSDIVEYIMPGIRQLLKEDLAELRRRQQEMLDAIRGGFVLTCPYGWVYHDDNCYLFTQHRSTWQNMREHCNARGGGYLAEIRCREENEFVKEELRKRHQEHTRGSVSYFLGGTDREREGVWKWIRTGELIEFKDFKPPEPNNDNSEHCLTLFGESDFGWNDDQCDKKLHGICKISVGYKFT